MSTKDGLVHAYIGNGKGKTTAALGLAMRAAGQGMQVTFFQFLKEVDKKTGELKTVKKLESGFEIRQYGGNLLDGDTPAKRDNIKRRISDGIKYIEDIAKSETCDILVLDEIGWVIELGLIDAKKVIEIIKNKPAKTELVLTGQTLPEEVLDLADYITEMRQMRHPFQRGIQARKGIEY